MKLLFDGKSIEHFRNYNKPTGPVSDKWVVKDGELVLTGKGGGDIITKDQYQNYELVLEYKITKGGNSGLMFGVIEQPKKPPTTAARKSRSRTTLTVTTPRRPAGFTSFTSRRSTSRPASPSMPPSPSASGTNFGSSWPVARAPSI